MSHKEFDKTIGKPTNQQPAKRLYQNGWVNKQHITDKYKSDPKHVPHKMNQARGRSGIKGG